MSTDRFDLMLATDRGVVGEPPRRRLVRALKRALRTEHGRLLVRIVTESPIDTIDNKEP
jgi:hypothetical protein